MVDQNTRWKMPGAKDFLTLAFLHDWLGKYDKATSEHIGLVEQGGGGGLGIFLLDRREGGYQRDTIFYDGPIFYGTGMNDADRQRTWKNFFMKMVEATLRQQGKETLEAKLTRAGAYPVRTTARPPLMPILSELGANRSRKRFF